LCLVEFLANYDAKANKICSKSKIIRWVFFNQHKDLENYYRKLLFIFKPFQKSKLNLQNNCDSWKDVYMEQKNDIKKCEKKLYIILTHPTILILNGTI
jgi:hypothetical protein